MKKLLTILLVLLVAGFAFAADATEVSNATLTLGSSVEHILRHGFVKNEVQDPDFGTISAVMVSTVNDNDYDTIKLLGETGEETSTYPVGYHYFVANTSETDYVVAFGVQAFANTDGVQVPYKLEYKELAGSLSNASVSGSGSGVIQSVGAVAFDGESSNGVTVITTNTTNNGAKHAGLELEVVINGEDNRNAGIAAGAYTAYVYANVSSI